ncbi:MAG: alpha/beta hydrolase [Candidatus Obscuribacterales bacterium]|nr:alpha/beta hydrolase [Candidatus Obscuribacterales bacterium]
MLAPFSAIAARRALVALTVTSAAAALVKVWTDIVAEKSESRFPPGGRFLEVHRVRLHYLSAGNGFPLVVLHGNDGSAADFEMSMLDTLASEYRTYVFDRPGHGYSDPVQGASRYLDRHSAILHGAFKRLGLKRALVLGHSWGALLALNHALRYPNDVAGLLLVAPVGFYTHEIQTEAFYRALSLPILGEFVARILMLFGRTRIDRALERAFYPQKPPKDYLEAFASMLLRPGQLISFARDELCINSSVEQISDMYCGVAAPVSILCGDKDRLVYSDNQAQRLKKAIPGAELRVIENAGHMIPFTHPAEVMESLRELRGRIAPPN